MHGFRLNRAQASPPHHAIQSQQALAGRQAGRRTSSRAHQYVAYRHACTHAAALEHTSMWYAGRRAPALVLTNTWHIGMRACMHAVALELTSMRHACRRATHQYAAYSSQTLPMSRPLGPKHAGRMMRAARTSFIWTNCRAAYASGKPLDEGVWLLLLPPCAFSACSLRRASYLSTHQRGLWPWGGWKAAASEASYSAGWLLLGSLRGVPGSALLLLLLLLLLASSPPFPAACAPRAPALPRRWMRRGPRAGRGSARGCCCGWRGRRWCWGIALIDPRMSAGLSASLQPGLAGQLKGESPIYLTLKWNGRAMVILEVA